MTRLSIDLGAAGASVPRIAKPAAMTGEFSRIIGGIAAPAPIAAPSPKKLRMVLAEQLTRSKIAIRAPQPRKAAAQPDPVLPQRRQTLAASEAPKADKKNDVGSDPDTVPQVPAEVVPPVPIAAVVAPAVPTAIVPSAVPAPAERGEVAVAPIPSAASAEQATAPVALPATPADPIVQTTPAPLPVAAQATATPGPVAVDAPEIASTTTPAVAIDEPASTAPRVPVAPPPPAPSETPEPPQPSDIVRIAGLSPGATAAALPRPVLTQPAGAGESSADKPSLEPAAQPLVEQARFRPTIQANAAQPQAEAALAMAAAAVRTIRDEWRPGMMAAIEPLGGVTAAVSTTPLSAPAVPAPVSAPAPAAPIPLDTGRAEWIEAMIDHIDELSSHSPVRTTQIRLLPDALGQIDVAIRKEGGEVHVNFTVDTAAARTLIADATPRLAELADARGLKLGGTGVETGSGGERRANQPINETIANLMHADGEEGDTVLPGRDRIA